MPRGRRPPGRYVLAYPTVRTPPSIPLRSSILILGTLAACHLSCSKGGKQEVGRPETLSVSHSDSLLRSYDKDRTDTMKWLRESPTSYFATVLRQDFGDSPTIHVGSAAGNEVRLEGPGVKPHHLNVTVTGDSFHVEAVDPGATFASGKDTL